MTGFGAFFGKELLEIRRTWRAWVIPGLVVFFGITSPILALVTPSLIESLATSQPGFEIKMPDPTARDAVGQFLKNLSQLVMFAVVIGSAGAVSGERSSGTAVLALSKPLARSAFVLAKLTADELLLIAATVAGTVICGLITVMLFGTVSWGSLVAATALWLVLAMLLTAVVHLCSVLFRSRGAAAGAGLGFFFLLLLIGIWPPIERYTFVGLSRASALAIAGAEVPWVWPVTTGVVAIALSAGAAARRFANQEL